MEGLLLAVAFLSTFLLGLGIFVIVASLQSIKRVRKINYIGK